MTVRALAARSRASLRRGSWLLMVALPIILAACGNSGMSGY
jgi:hypothetical protein